MELGADGVLINSAIALAKSPLKMASAMNYGVKAGREAFLAGRIEKQRLASASSPEKNISIKWYYYLKKKLFIQKSIMTRNLLIEEKRFETFYNIFSHFGSTL